MSTSPLQSHAALAAIVDIAADAIIALDAAFRIIRYNRGAEQIFGWTEAEMLGQPLDRLLPMAARSVHRSHLRGFADGTTDARPMGERRLISGLRRSGESFPAEASIARVVVDDALTVMVVLRDASERRQREERQRLLGTAGWVLASSLDVESTMATATELPVPLLADWCLLDLVTPEGQWRRMAATHRDPAHQDITAGLVARQIPFSANDESVWGAARLVHEPQALAVSDVVAWRAANFPEAAHQRRVDALGAGAVLVVPLRAGGRALGLLHLVRGREAPRFQPDEVQVADQYGSLAALALENARLYQEARQAVRERDEMLAIVSHDLRNPVNAIVLLTGAALERAGHAPTLLDRTEVEHVRAAARQANGLIQDLQDVTRISAGRLRIDQRPVLLDELIDEMAHLFGPTMVEAGLHFSCTIDREVPPLPLDRVRMGQVISNLLANAVRFTPEGGQVECALVAHATSVAVTVRDTGPGISAEDLPRLFERYWQAPRLLRSGSGLGLYIVKGIVEAHGGRVSVESTLGAGSTFTVTLPLPE